MLKEEGIVSIRRANPDKEVHFFLQSLTRTLSNVNYCQEINKLDVG